MSTRMRIDARVTVAIAAAMAFVAPGCETVKHTGEKALYDVNPVGTADVVVLGVSRHGSYLLVSLAGSLVDMRFIAPATEACLQVLAPEAHVNYAKSGVFGRFRRDGTICDPNGIASLAAWRDRQPNLTRRPVPRAPVYYTLLQEDPELIFLRGRFPLVSRVNIPAGYDIVAVLPNAGACTGLAQRTNATLEFRSAGPEPFVMLNDNQLCPVMGFATPSVASGTAEP
jgi:hypothetical protein